MSQLLVTAMNDGLAPQHALRAYEYARLAQANHVLKGSQESGEMYEFNGPLRQDFTKLGPQIEKQWDWIMATDPEGDVRKAIEWMKHHV